MPTLNLVNGGGDLQVSDAAFGQQFNEALVHQVIVAYRNASRSGTKAQKTRAEVRGGGLGRRSAAAARSRGRRRARARPAPVPAAARSGWVADARLPRSRAASS